MTVAVGARRRTNRLIERNLPNPCAITGPPKNQVGAGMIDVGLLSIDGAIFHQVPARNSPIPEGETLAPVLSTVESNLDATLEFFLRDRVTRTFSHAQQPVLRDEDSDSPTPDLVTSALAGATPPNIVGPFQPLAHLLLDVQAHNSPKGLLAIIRGACGATPVLVIVKVEQERGLSFDTITENGETRVEVVVEDGLVFTDKTEVFKSAIFYIDGGGELQGLITDDQSGSTYSGPVSQYWLSDFLGCKYRNSVDVLTRSWIKATNRLVKSDISDPKQKSDVLAALHAELASNRANINPKAFIRDHVPADLQDDALQRLLNEGAPTTSFPKSPDVANSAPSRKKMYFESGYEVSMPSETEPDLTVEAIDGQEIHTLTIRGRIRRVE